MRHAFFVHGRPVPQGSKRHVGKGIMVEMGKDLQPWRDSVAYAARGVISQPLDGAVSLRLTFFFDRPKSHFGTGRNIRQVKPGAPRNHLIAPDADKLARAVLDALTGVLFRDDAQVHELTIFKRYTTVPGVGILVGSNGQGVTIAVIGE